MTQNVLRIDASARHDGSVSRQLVDRITARMGDAHVVTRDLSAGVPLIDEHWVGANFTPEAERSDAQRAILATSDSYVGELKAADTVIIGVPIYNFGVPAALKAWVDQVARAGVTFRYTENGPVGLLEGKRAILVVASGGTAAHSEIDFATGFMEHILGFLGIKDVEIVAADRLMLDAESTMKSAQDQVDNLVVAA